MNGFKLDGTVSLGHLLTAITLLISVVAAYYSLREDIRANSIRIEHIERIIDRDIKAMNVSINSIRELMEHDMQAINKSMDRIYKEFDRRGERGGR